ncbi:amidase family protein [Amycolatopsis nigrescens]|uniref:amidase family protein n=1 Tax=Amycolatopsis nigrescens TaxID=381445 RepID=UPI00036514C2|nr:amidase family protein [Amycolatopsis nigrescens]
MPVRRLVAILLAASLLVTLVATPAYASRTPVDVVGLGVADLRVLLDQRKVTSLQLVGEYLRRTAAYENAYAGQPGVNAVIAVNPRARAEAVRLDVERRLGHSRGPLHGIPIVLKDNYDTRDLPTTSGSVALRDLRPDRDATQVRRLRDAGAIILAKTNLHEFAISITTISSLGGQTRNPYDQGRHPGGSSGGTAAAVAAGFAPAGMGTDTCGSIRIPAAHNNLVGLRPTLGLSSRAGIAPLAGTQDTAGPLASSIRDIALLLDATAGYDPADPVTEAAKGRIPAGYQSTLRPDSLRGKRIGVFTDNFGGSPAEQLTNGVVRAAIADMAALGAQVIELGRQPEVVDSAAKANRVRDEFERDLNGYLAGSAGGRPSSLARLEPPRDEVTLADIATSGQVTPTVLSTLRDWVASPPLPNPAYQEKLRQRDILRTGLTALITANGLDGIVYPTVNEPPTPIGTTQSYANCRLAGYSGFPALSVPAGFTAAGLPVGVELLGLPFSEPDLLAMGYAYEQATRHRMPPASTPPLR